MTQFTNEPFINTRTTTREWKGFSITFLPRFYSFNKKYRAILPYQVDDVLYIWTTMFNCSNGLKRKMFEITHHQAEFWKEMVKEKELFALKVFNEMKVPSRCLCVPIKKCLGKSGARSLNWDFNELYRLWVCTEILINTMTLKASNFDP